MEHIHYMQYPYSLCSLKDSPNLPNVIKPVLMWTNISHLSSAVQGELLADADLGPTHASYTKLWSLQLLAWEYSDNEIHFLCSNMAYTIFHYTTWSNVNIYPYSWMSPWIVQYTLNDVPHNPGGIHERVQLFVYTLICAGKWGPITMLGDVYHLNSMYQNL